MFTVFNHDILGRCVFASEKRGIHDSHLTQVGDRWFSGYCGSGNPYYMTVQGGMELRESSSFGQNFVSDSDK